VTVQLWPSTADRWRVCPASAVFKGQFPQAQTESERWGKIAHGVASSRLTAMLSPINGVRGSVEAEDAEMEETIQTYVDAVLALPPAALACVQIETPHVTHFGVPVRPDLVAHDKAAGTLHVVEFKTGHRLVEAYRNAQAVCAASACWEYGNFVFHLVQPRGFHRHGPVRTWAFTKAEMEVEEAILREAADAARRPDPPFVPTPDGCELCAGRHACEALHRSVLAAVEVAGSVVPLDLTGVALARQLDQLETAGALIDARLTGLKVQAETAIREGGSVPGWVMAPGRGSTAWTGTDAEIIAMLGLTVQAPAKAITPTQAGKLGLPAELLTCITQRQPGALKLERYKP